MYLDNLKNKNLHFVPKLEEMRAQNLTRKSGRYQGFFVLPPAHSQFPQLPEIGNFWKTGTSSHLFFLIEWQILGSNSDCLLPKQFFNN